MPKAIELANKYELDLIEVATQAVPPVCKIGDFSKYKYELEKKERLAKKNQTKTHFKEIRLSPNIDDHDYQVKLRQLIGFLEKKDKVKVTILFRGRQMEHQELGRGVMERFIADSNSQGQVEKNPVLEGRMLSTILVPK